MIIYELLECLRKHFHQIARVAKESTASMDEFLTKQRRLESSFVNVLWLLQDRFGIRGPRVHNHADRIIQAKGKVGRTSPAAIQEAQLVEGIPGVWHLDLPPSYYSRMTPDVVSFLKGRYATGGREVATIRNFGCHLFHKHSLIYVCYDAGLGAHRVVRGDRSENTGMFQRPTSIAVSSDQVWVAGDVRIRAFKLNDLKPCDTLHVREDVVWESGMAVWGGYVILGTGRDIFTWRVKPPRWGGEHGVIEVDGRDVGSGLKASEIDWRRGRLPRQKLKLANELGRITVICAAGDDYLAVGSCDYPVVHIFAASHGGLVRLRLIGHRLGVTSLLWSGKQLLSGSADKSTRIWKLDKRGEVLLALEGQSEAVSALAFGEFDKQEFAFSGDLGGTVHAWHVTYQKAPLQIDVGEGWYAAGLDLDGETGTLQIVARRRDDLTVEDEADKMNLVAEIQTFQFSLGCEAERRE